MIKELDSVVLSRDLPEYGLKKGDIGAVVHYYKSGEAFEVEFINGVHHGTRFAAFFSIQKWNLMHVFQNINKLTPMIFRSQRRMKVYKNK